MAASTSGNVASVANLPQFTFPMIDLVANPTSDSSPASRFDSTSTDSPRFIYTPSRPRHASQRNSVSALPTFSFNSSDASGLRDSHISTFAALPTPTSATRAHGHRRGASELVGKHHASSPAQSVSPFNFTPTTMLAPDTPVRKGHAHRRSAAISVSDIPQFPLLSATPVSLPAPIPAVNAARPPSPERANLRVGFADHVEVIPRPLSIVSTLSTGSNSTVTSLANAATDFDRGLQDGVILDLALADPFKEGSWLKRGSPPIKAMTFGLDTFNLQTSRKPCHMELSAIEEILTPRFVEAERSPQEESSLVSQQEQIATRPPLQARAWSAPIPTLSHPSTTYPPTPDLEALFSHDPFTIPDETLGLDMTRLDANPSFVPEFDRGEADRKSNLPYITIDLDEAERPRNGSRPFSELNVPMTGPGARRPLHSSRSGPALSIRRRAESAPTLARFEHSLLSSPNQSPMADVFEEDEDEHEDTVGRADTVRSSDLVMIKDGLGIERIVKQAPPGSGTRTSDGIDIVAAEDEPRDGSRQAKAGEGRLALSIPTQPSLTTPTTLQGSLMTPTTYAASTFSTPDMTRRLSAFEVSYLSTSASSMAESKSVSSTTDEDMLRPSVDGVPSLSSTRSSVSRKLQRRPRYPRSTSAADLAVVEDGSLLDRRRKRASIQGLSKLMGPFGNSGTGNECKDRPESSLWIPSPVDSESSSSTTKRRQGKTTREGRLSKLMFWKRP